MSLLDEHGWPASTPQDQLRRVLNALPPIARQKFQALQRQVSDSKALTRASMARSKELEDGYYLTINRLQLLDPRHDADSISRLRGEVEQAEADIAREQQELSRHNQRGRNAEQVVAQLRDQFLLSQRLQWPVRPANVVPRRRQDESVKDALLHVRADIGLAKNQLSQLKTAPPTAAEIKQQLRRQVQDLAAKGTPTISLNDGKATVQFADTVQFANAGSPLSAPSGSASALLCALFPQQIGELLESAVPEVPNGISSEDRSRRIAELEQHIAGLEHEEESLVDQALAAGLDCHRRPQASPYALLGIEHYDRTEEDLVAAE